MAWYTVVPLAQATTLYYFMYCPPGRFPFLRANLELSCITEAFCFQVWPAYFVEPDLNSFFLGQMVYKPINPRFGVT